MSMTRIKGMAFTTVLTTTASFAGSHAYEMVHDHGHALLVGVFLLAVAGVGVHLVRRG